MIAGDAEIRAALRERFITVATPSHLVNEVAVGACRADLLLLSDELVGYEIKGERDSLKRLPRQVDAYSAAFGRCWIAYAARHRDGVEVMVPTWWGRIEVSSNRFGGLDFGVREADPNPAGDSFATARLLWNWEAEKLLEVHGGARGWRGKRNVALAAELARRLPVEQLRAEVSRLMRSRPDWPAASRVGAVGARGRVEGEK